MFFFLSHCTCTCVNGSCMKISTYLLSGSSVLASVFIFFVISSMLLNGIRSRSSLSFLSRTDTTNFSEYLILHTLVVVAEISVGSTFSPKISLTMLDFPLLVSPIKETPLKNKTGSTFSPTNNVKIEPQLPQFHTRFSFFFLPISF